MTVESRNAGGSPERGEAPPRPYISKLPQYARDLLSPASLKNEGTIVLRPQLNLYNESVCSAAQLQPAVYHDVPVRAFPLQVAAHFRRTAQGIVFADGQFLLVRLGRYAAADDLATSDHRDPIRDVEDLIELVADEDDRGVQLTRQLGGGP